MIIYDPNGLEGSLPALIQSGGTGLHGKSQSSTNRVLPNDYRVVCFYRLVLLLYEQLQYGKVYPMRYSFSRIFYAYEQSCCLGSDKPLSSSQSSPAGIEYFRRCLQVLLSLPSSASSSLLSTSGCFEAVRCSSPKIFFYMVRDVLALPMEQPPSLRLNHIIKLRVKSVFFHIF